MNNLKDAGANLINNIADNTEIVKEVYDDGLKPAVVETGKALTESVKGVTRIGRLINALFSSIDCWILEREYAIKETQKLLDKKLENIPDEDIETPKNYIAVPALQALSYSMDSKELRNMYANLLAKSMYTKTADKVHPAYVDIIRQLDPMDIRILEYIASKEYIFAIKKLNINNISNNRSDKFLCIATSIEFASVDEVTTSIDNLSRLGLIEQMGELFDKKFYKEIDDNPISKKFYKKLELEIKDSNNEKIIHEHNAMCMTILGRTFYKICNEEIE